MASDDEVDYMSDAFLESICANQDIRPGLMKSHAQQYDHKRAVNKLKCDESNRFRNPSFKEKEAVSREDGLNKPLDSDNVGFKMLQKLGFKPGSGLGRSGEGRIEPISVEVKADRQGLGRKKSLEEITRMRAKYRAEAREKLLNVSNYRERKAEEAAERKAAVDLMKTQRVCWELDSQECIDEPAEVWFWPEHKLPTHEDDDEEEENENRPSNTKTGDKTESEGGEEESEHFEDEEEEFSVPQKLEMLTLYLRRTYLYCVWCGHKFDDEKDLQQECPGPMRDDH